MKIRYIAFILMSLVTGILAACGGGGSSTSGFAQTYTSSAGAGEVLQFSVNTTNMTYSYKVIQSSYNVPLNQTSTGILTSKSAVGSYTVGTSSDGFIQSGVVLPIQNGLLVGHVLISSIGGLAKIPVFGVSNPITTPSGLADTYNFQGFNCAGKSGGNVLTGGVACASHTGTISVNGSGGYTVCNGGNITATPSCSTSAGTITATATPGVYDIQAGGFHRGWFLAFTAPNGQKVAVIDHDDASTPAYGHSVASTQAVMVAGAADGNYFTNNNEGGAGLLTVNGTTYTHTLTGTSGTMTLNSPWNGLTTNQGGDVAMIAGTGAFTHTSASDTALFGIGLRY